MTQRSLAETLTGAVVLVVAVGFLGYAVVNTGRTPVSGYPLHARFDRIDGLFVGADVRVAGVKVGSITATRVDPQSFQAEVAFNVQSAVRLPADTSAEITSDGLLGSKYLALVPGGDTAMIAAGGAVTITQSAISIEQLLGKFIFAASNLTGGKAPDGKPPDGKAPGGRTGDPPR